MNLIESHFLKPLSRQTGLAFSLAGCLLIAGCPPTIVDTPDPPAETAVPKATSCGSFVIACYDELPHESANINCFRPTSRWNKTHLTWRLAAPLDQFDLASQLDVLDRAFEKWAEVSALSFERVEEGADINISFEEASHGDPFPFDGSGSILGHAYFPGTLRAGDVHLCSAEPWSLDQSQGTIDLFTVAMHEVGHALGLEHTSAEGSVMSSSYPSGGLSELSEDDKNAIIRLYGSADGTVPPEPILENVAECAPANFSVECDPEIDSDCDGIPDSIEIFILDTDPFLADSDRDGVDDRTEVFVNRTPPSIAGLLNDADQDGLSDTAERDLGTNPNLADTDGDGVEDGKEVFLFGTNPLIADSDGDGIVDGEDFAPTNQRFSLDCRAIAPQGGPGVAGSADCNANGIPDECDIASGATLDRTANGIPDVCEEQPCDDGDACTIDTVNGSTCAYSAVNCDDGDPCTVDSCGSDGSCQNVDQDGSCDDGNPCTDGDTCASGDCVGIPVVCAEGEICSLVSGLCVPDVRACCTSTGMCQDLPPDECTSNSGAPGTIGSTCRNSVCSTGACCFANGVCDVRTSASCGAIGGSYHGNGSTCAAIGCQTGACCLSNTACLVTDASNCTLQGGTFQGAETACHNESCTENSPVLPCCIDGICELFTTSDCERFGGLPLFNQSNCPMVPIGDVFEICADKLVGLWSMMELDPGSGELTGDPIPYYFLQNGSVVDGRPLFWQGSAEGLLYELYSSYSVSTGILTASSCPLPDLYPQSLPFTELHLSQGSFAIDDCTGECVLSFTETAVTTDAHGGTSTKVTQLKSTTRQDLDSDVCYRSCNSMCHTAFLPSDCQRDPPDPPYSTNYGPLEVWVEQVLNSLVCD